ncbi:MAG: YggT family protein [Clostridia bacterium]|nr:YggT family protein [Clostridia bacterium]
MPIAIELIRGTVAALLGALELAMLARMLFSLFDPTGEGKLSSFLFVITEPIILPVRALCAKMGWFEDTPIDVPFTITWFLLILVQILVEVL